MCGILDSSPRTREGVTLGGHDSSPASRFFLPLWKPCGVDALFVPDQDTDSPEVLGTKFVEGIEDVNDNGLRQQVRKELTE